MGQVGGREKLDEIYFVQKVKLGQGSFGTVWRAKHRKSGITVAIKQMDKASMPKRGVKRQDIEREVTMMKACSHEYITKLYDTFEDQTSIYLALEYCDGGDFGDKVRELGPVIKEEDTAEWMRQMCEALNHLHVKGICHRDIKPDNFMVLGDSTLKLSDFGLAVHLPQGGILTDKCGTPAFMAPEQHMMPVHSRGYGFPVDMWAAGVSMYMIIFGGRHPFLNRRNELDQRQMLEGKLDFTDTSSVAAQGLGLFGLGETIQKFSEPARSFCKQLVQVNQASRLTASNALRMAWLNSGRRVAEQKRKLTEGSPSNAEAAGRGDSRPRAGSARGDAPSPMGYPQGDGRTPKGTGKGPSERFGMEAPKAPQPGLPPRGDAPNGQSESVQIRRELEKENEKLKQSQAQLEAQLAEVKKQNKDFRTQRTKEIAAQEVPREAVQRESPVTLMASTAPRLLPPGTKCRYEPTSSTQYPFLPAVIQGFNDLDCTYNLDVRPHAQPSRISPAKEITAEQAWPRGTLVNYFSQQREQQGAGQSSMPAVVKSFNEMDQTYNLDIRDHADCDRIRVRAIPKEAAEAADPGLTSAMMRPALEKRNTKKLDSQEAGKLAEEVLETDAAAADAEVQVLGRHARIGQGFWCHIPEHDLFAPVVAVRGGIAELDISGSMTELKLEALRAPKEERLAWPKGTEVMYYSGSLCKWIIAHIEGFNRANCTYNLDVRQEADPEKVRPR
ncbi:Dclk3 [Symbiodinium pilosum]|uniref:Dclk3 protein n=1 Tax=Symbiodinium pilosum TaxID=2952 RepID=A0A812RQJ2_SYMPI|nr:Dclk3 [Symbiodinium pilosum]